MQTCFLCVDDYYWAANYKLLPVTFLWLTSPYRCIYDRDVFMSHWRHLPCGQHREPGMALEYVPVALRAFSSAKMLKKNLFESKSPLRLPAHPAWLVAAYSHLPDQLLCAQTSSKAESSTQFSKVNCKHPAPKAFCFQLGEGSLTFVAPKSSSAEQSPLGAPQDSVAFLGASGSAASWRQNCHGDPNQLGVDGDKVK